LDDINEWQDVQILIIDEISFMSDSVLKRLDKKLKQIGNGARVYGGLSIIFSGDFCQLESVCSNESKLLFSCLSSGLCDNSINIGNHIGQQSLVQGRSRIWKDAEKNVEW
jgi:hypothetical protein